MNSTTARVQIQNSPGGLTLDTPARVFHPMEHRTARPLHSGSSAPGATFRQSNPAARSIQSVSITGPAGRLEAILNQGAPDARFAALVCHPHPAFGGNLHNKVVYNSMKVFNDPYWGLGLPVLRFNFRGTGLSEGSHDGEAEFADVLAGLDWLERQFRLPIVLAGFSFGAAMALHACAMPRLQHDVRAIIALGLPLIAEPSQYRYSFLESIVIPKLFLSGDRDRFAHAAELSKVVASAAEPKRLVLVPGADHFFTNQLEPMQNALAGWLKEQLQ